MEHCLNIRRQLIHFFPALQEIQILRSWVVPSPFTADYEPVFGKTPVPGLIVAAGFKSAAVMSAVVGEIVRDLVQKDTCAWDLSQYTASIRRI